jgi:hypothetical protein
VDLESAAELEALVAVVRTLPQKTQQVLILRKVYSWPVERIAERALLSEAAVLRHLATAARDLEAAARACTRGIIEPSVINVAPLDTCGAHAQNLRADEGRQGPITSSEPLRLARAARDQHGPEGARSPG